MIPLPEVLRFPVISEKSLQLAMEQNAYTFRVHPEATKDDVRAAVEELFGIERILAVRMVKLPGKTRTRYMRNARVEGGTPARKKAVVRLHEDESLMEHFQPG